NDPTNESGFLVERSADGTTFAQIATVGAGVTSYHNTGLTANTTYYYRVRSYNSAGDSGYSNTASATTPASQQPPAPPSNLTATAAASKPAAPSNLTATTVSTSEIDLAWVANSTNATSFKIQVSKDGFHFAHLATLSANLTSYKDTGLKAGVTYYFRVRAVNAV